MYSFNSLVAGRSGEKVKKALLVIFKLIQKFTDTNGWLCQ